MILIDYFWAGRSAGRSIKKSSPLGRNGMLPSYRTMKYKSPIWGYFHVQKE